MRSPSFDRLRMRTDGRLLLAAVSTADRHDSHDGVALLQASRRLWPFLAHCFADQAYQGERVGKATAITVEIVRPDKGQKGPHPEPVEGCRPATPLGNRADLRMDRPLSEARP